MDSITQASLGAVVAYAAWNKDMRNWAFAWGAFLGTVPDLDVLFSPLLSQVEAIYWHRGESHSIFLTILLSFILAFFIKKRYKDISYKRLYIGVFLIYFTHVLIDYFTIYGTQLLAPLSRYGFAHGNFFIIDPLFTLPMLFAMLFVIFKPKSFGPKTINTSLFIICTYTIYSLFAHAYANNIIIEKLKNQGINTQNSFTAATPFNTIYWRNVTKVDKGFYISYYSLLSKNFSTKFIPQNKELLEPFINQKNTQALEWFSKGFYILRQKEDKIVFSDLRFGEIKEKDDEDFSKWNFNFSWQIDKEADKLKRYEGETKDMKKVFSNLYKNI